MPRKAKSALVIGGGVVGAASAFRLRQLGLRTTLVDPCDGSAASLGNAGHIAVEQVAPLASWPTIMSAPRRWFGRGGALDVSDPIVFLPWASRFMAAARKESFQSGSDALRSLLLHALPAWRRLAKEIGRTDLLSEAGHLLVWESTQTASKGRAAWEAADTGTARIQPLPEATLDSLWGLTRNRPVDGIRFSGTAQVSDLGDLANSLEAAFLAAGGEIIASRVESLSNKNGAASAHLANGQNLTADIVLVAAGVGSARLMSGLGHRAPLIAERGYHLRWTDHDWPADLSPIVFEDRSMIVTRFAGGLQAASFVEFGTAGQKPDPRKWARLAAHVKALGLPVRGEPSAWIGCRPTLPDYLPAIGRSDTAQNLYYAFGHQHLGLTLGPITAEIVAALADGREPPVALQPFDLNRFESRKAKRA
ncbi:FAD-binding oxidoreductase [Caulobacter segnis]|uniref:NAD(P)/FAD-dependent oxidoreductase n=1 Tax=Caulobacter segnis TaxID=88688 RepID=UPI00240F2291|nr:FAD-binding oxidoreductase [Caulobacter segnis]MDG2523491.1 FAD-binding oxidoreductase [Caulobacter segnis]